MRPLQAWLIVGVGLAVVAAVAMAGAPAHHAIAKEPVTNIWLVGGDLLHPVRIPNEELQNPGSTSGEGFSELAGAPPGDLGPGYDVLSGDDLASALRSPAGGFETFYPRGNGSHALEYWSTASGVYSATPSDRIVQNWNIASGGRFEIYPRYIALAKAGLIGEQPTFGQAIAASVKLLGAGARVDGQQLSAHGADALASALASLSQTSMTLPANAPVGIYRPVELWFGRGASTSLIFLYAPPGTLGKIGTLFPQLAPMPPPPAGDSLYVPVYNTTLRLDSLLKHDIAVAQGVTPSGGVNWWLVAAAVAGALCVASGAAGGVLWRRRARARSHRAPHAA